MTFEIVYLQLEVYVGRSMQENLNSVVTDGKLNNAIVPYALDTKDKHILAVQNPLQVTFKDVKKFGPQYPIIGKLLTQIESSKLTEKRIRDQLGQIKDREIETRLLNLRSNNNNSNNSNNNNNDVGRRLTEHRPPPPPPLSSHSPPNLFNPDPFDPFFGATAPPYLPSLPRNEPSVLPYPRDVPPPPDYNTLFTEKIAITDTDPNLRAGSSRRPVIGVILRVKEAELLPDLPPEDQMRLTPRLRRTFPELSEEEEEPETA